MAKELTTIIEEAMIAQVELLGIFKAVHSIGRDGQPKMKTYPTASIYFDSDNDDTDRINPRPVPDFYYVILVQQQNHSDEKKAARDAYSLMEELRVLFNGSTLDLDFIQPIRLIARRLVKYEAGQITYAMRFRIPVVMEPIR